MSETDVSGGRDFHNKYLSLCQLCTHSLLSFGTVSGPQGERHCFNWSFLAERELLECVWVSLCHSSYDLCPFPFSASILYFALLAAGPGQVRSSAVHPPPPLHLLRWMYEVMQQNSKICYCKMHASYHSIDFYVYFIFWHSWTSLRVYSHASSVRLYLGRVVL